MKIIQALAITLVLAAGAFATMQDLLTAMTPTTTSPGCTSFSPFVTDGDIMYTPRWGPPPPKAVVTKLLHNLYNQTSYRCIQTYDMGGASPVYADILEIADSLGMKVLGHVYLDYA